MVSIPRPLALILAVTGLAAVEASAKLLSLDERCRCVREGQDHREYVRCIRQNAKRYIRFEARFAPADQRRRLTRAEVRAAARARVAEAVASRCGIPEYLCDLVDRPCPAGETCDVRGCEITVGVCVPTPASCPTDGKPRCTCAGETDPYGRTYANECERLRAGARTDPYSNSPFTSCAPSCGGPEKLECPAPLVCRYPDWTCGVFDEHGRCEEPQPTVPGAVCGCDGTTYPGRDEAAQAGVRVAHPNECGELCGGPPAFQCRAGAFCMKEWGRCNRPAVWGTCRELTSESCLQLGPVCGCDGVMYPRACEAVFAGTDVAGYPVNGVCPAQ